MPGRLTTELPLADCALLLVEEEEEEVLLGLVPMDIVWGDGGGYLRHVFGEREEGTLRHVFEEEERIFWGGEMIFQAWFLGRKRRGDIESCFW